MAAGEKSLPAFVHEDELVLCGATDTRRLALTSIRSVTSKHSLFMVRRYRSFSEHLAFIEFTLNDGTRFYSLAESQVLEFLAGKETLNGLQTAVLNAKTKSLIPNSCITL